VRRDVRSVFHGSQAERAAALSEAVIPHGLVVPIVRGIVAMTIMVIAVVASALLVPVAVLRSSLRKPFIIVSIGRRGRHSVVRRAITGVGRRERSGPLVVAPSSIARAIVRAVRLGRVVALVLDKLVLVVGLGRVTAAVVSRNIGVDGRDHRSGSLAIGLGLALLQLLPLTPVLEPGLVVLAAVEVDVKAPAHRLDPIKLKCVEFSHGNAADLGPGAVLERVIVEKLAAQEERDGEVSPNLSLGGLVVTLGLHRVDPLGEVVHAKEDSGAGQPRRSENLGDELPEGRGDSRLGSDQANRHVGNVFSHRLDLIVEDGAHATGHLEGDGGGEIRLRSQ
jgi:hypothetical protein